MSETAVIELRLTRKSRRWYFVIVVILAIAFLYGAFQTQGDDPQTGALPALSLCGMALLAFLLWRQSRRGAGRVQADAEGLLIDTTMALGRVNWDNLEKVAVFKRLWSPFLGIGLKDPKAYIESRAGLHGKYALDMNLLNIGNRIASLSPAQGADVLSKIIPYPQLGMDLDLLAENRKNFGFDLCISLTGVDGGQSIPARIEALRPDTVATPVVVQPNAGEFKTCPQCAEQVRSAAKICRFCGNSFAPETAEA